MKEVKGAKMKEYKINVTVKVLKEVYQITKALGLDFLVLGSEKEIEIDYKKIINTLLTTDLTNRFCRLITGDYETDFDDLNILEQERLITSFFSDMVKLSKESILIGEALRNMIQVETPSLTSALPSDSTESTPTT